MFAAAAYVTGYNYATYITPLSLHAYFVCLSPPVVFHHILNLLVVKTSFLSLVCAVIKSNHLPIPDEAVEASALHTIMGEILNGKFYM